MVQEDLLHPSLDNQGWERPETYDIGKLVYVAFFGGLIPTVILSAENARNLKVDKKYIQLMTIAGLLVFLIKVGMTWSLAADGNQALMSSQEIRWGFRIANLLVFLGFYWLMKGRFQRLVMTGGAQIVPLFKKAVLWSMAGALIESVVLLGGGYLFSNGI